MQIITKYSSVFSASLLASTLVGAQVKTLDDATLGDITGQVGIGIDLDVAVSIAEILYVDSDGFTTDTNNGTQGTVSVSEVLIGRVTGDAANGFGFDVTGAPISINNITIDVDDDEGVVIDFGEVGNFGDGLDFASNFNINGDNAGAFFVDDFSNEISDEWVTMQNGLFGLQLQTPSELQTTNGQAVTGTQFLSNQVRIDSLEAGESGLDIALDFGGNIGSAGWYDTDSGLGVGFTNLALFRTVDPVTGEDVAANAPGALPAPLQFDMRIDVVDYTRTNGDVVGALQLTGIDFKGTIAISDIFIGTPSVDPDTLRSTNSIGSLLIRDLSLQETTVTIYAR